MDLTCWNHIQKVYGINHTWSRQTRGYELHLKEVLSAVECYRRPHLCPNAAGLFLCLASRRLTATVECRDKSNENERYSSTGLIFYPTVSWEDLGNLFCGAPRYTYYSLTTAFIWGLGWILLSQDFGSDLID
jgi:hypothetical protein